MQAVLLVAVALQATMADREPMYRSPVRVVRKAQEEQQPQTRVAVRGWMPLLEVNIKEVLVLAEL
jgi:hypothetical protein